MAKKSCKWTCNVRQRLIIIIKNRVRCYYSCNKKQVNFRCCLIQKSKVDWTNLIRVLQLFCLFPKFCVNWTNEIFGQIT